MPGVPDPLYVVARRVLLDGLQALEPHHEALVLVGAQAIYLHTGEAKLAVAAYTTDADLSLDPSKLKSKPPLHGLMTSAGFRPGEQPGIWITTRSLGERPVEVALDLLVPDSLGGAGRRGARLPHHGNQIARKVRGLEAVLVDNSQMELSSLEREDNRRCHIRVAGPSSLLVTKLHKLGERTATPERLKPKDAYDVLRLLREIPMSILAEGLDRLQADAFSAHVTEEALAYLERLFVGGIGARLAAEAAAGLEPAAIIEASCTTLAVELLRS